MKKGKNKNIVEKTGNVKGLNELLNWKSLTENIPEYITNLSLDGTILYVNKTFTEIDKGKIIGKNLFDFLSSNQRDILRNNIKQCLDFRKEVEFESEILTLNGDKKLLFNRILIIPGPDNELILNIISRNVSDKLGEILDTSGKKGKFKLGKDQVSPESGDKAKKRLGNIAEIKDLSGQKNLENILKKKADEWNRTFDTMNSSIALLDKDGVIIRCNKSMLKLTGLTFKEILENKVCEILNQRIKNFKDCYVESVMKSGKKEERVLQIDESWFRSIMEPLISENGELTGSVLVLSNITEMKKKEIILEEQKNFFQSSIDSLPLPFYVIDTDSFKIIFKNKATDLIFPNKKSFCFRMAHDKESPCSEDQICPIIEIKKTAGPFISNQTFCAAVDGNKIYETHSYPIFNNSGKIIQMIQYSIDISKRMKDEEEAAKQKEILLHADRMISLGILVSGVAHEINNPNNSIRLNSSILFKAFRDIIPVLDEHYAMNRSLNIAGLSYNDFREEIISILNGIIKNSERIKSIVNELKLYSRKERSSFIEKIEINEVVKSAIDLLKGMIKKSTDNLQVLFAKDLPIIFGNFKNLEQVMINLIQNSCQASSSKKKSIFISTSVDERKEYVIINVEDDGGGINEEDRKYIMEPFFTTKREEGGTGLGLSISSKIIKEHNGSMEFFFEKNSTKVKITLPITKTNPAGEKK
ncbi:MAG: ATP-binding protein [Acidobacteriota bacterium]